jgi:hypothetical protein
MARQSGEGNNAGWRHSTAIAGIIEDTVVQATRTLMQIDEKAIDYLEQHIPELAESAMKQAYWQALASGSSVLEHENGVIYEVFPDGTRRAVKTVPAPTPVKAGEKKQLT